jgi:hypothetical protein
MTDFRSIDLNAQTGTQLVAIAAQVAAKLGAEFTTTKFKDKATAVRRVSALIEQLPADKANGKARTNTVSAVARELILAGKSNADVWAVLSTQFKLDDSKKHYPTWYRCELRRNGHAV